MKPITLKTMTLKIGLGFVLTLLGVTVLYGAPAKSVSVHPSGYRSAAFILTQDPVSGWTLAVRGGKATSYRSLHSPKLRKWVSLQPKGTIIGFYTPPAAPGAPAVPPVSGKSAAGRELTYFARLCKAHGIYFSAIPVTL